MWERRCAHWSLPRGCAKWNWVLQPGRLNLVEDSATNSLESATSCSQWSPGKPWMHRSDYHPPYQPIITRQYQQVQQQSCSRAKSAEVCVAPECQPLIEVRYWGYWPPPWHFQLLTCDNHLSLDNLHAGVFILPLWVPKHLTPLQSKIWCFLELQHLSFLLSNTKIQDLPYQLISTVFRAASCPNRSNKLPDSQHQHFSFCSMYHPAINVCSLWASSPMLYIFEGCSVLENLFCGKSTAY